MCVFVCYVCCGNGERSSSTTAWRWPSRAESSFAGVGPALWGLSLFWLFWLSFFVFVLLCMIDWSLCYVTRMDSISQYAPGMRQMYDVIFVWIKISIWPRHLRIWHLVCGVFMLRLFKKSLLWFLHVSWSARNVQKLRLVMLSQYSSTNFMDLLRLCSSFCGMIWNAWCDDFIGVGLQWWNRIYWKYIGL